MAGAGASPGVQMGQAASSIYIGRLYADHGRWLSGWLNRRTACPERADDLAHDTFRRLLERGEQAPLEDPRNYLAAVARHLLVDDVRRRELERAYLDAIADRERAELLTPERILEAVQMLDGLVRLLAGLPRPTCEAFLLRRLDGLSHDEIAAQMGVSTRTVKRHVAAAYAHCYAFAYPEG